MARNDPLYTSVKSNVGIPRAPFNLSEVSITTLNEGELVPFYLKEVLASDQFRVSEGAFIRSLTPLFPVMGVAHVDTFHFFCPMRLLWEHTKEFYKENNISAWAPSVTYTIPMVDLSAVAADRGADGHGFVDGCGPGSLFDHLTGVVLSDYWTTGDVSFEISILPFRMYTLVCNEWFRNQNIVDPELVSRGDIAGVSEVGDLWHVDKFRDRFTSALPAPQKGPSVALPLFAAGETASVLTGDTDRVTGVHPALRLRTSSGSPSADSILSVGTSGNLHVDASVSADPSGALLYPSNLFVSLDSVAASSVNSLRIAIATQRVYERLARSGSRFTEFLRAFFGALPADASLQRPEYLGGRSFKLDMRQVPQTSSSVSGSPLGNVGALSVTASGGYSFNRKFDEPGFLMSLACIRVEHVYSQGIDRLWTRKYFEDHYLPQYSHVGEMPIYSYELFLSGNVNDGDNGQVFGYRPAWDEYRRGLNRLSGFVRPELQNGFQAVTYGEYFTQRPFLDEAFIKENTAPVAQTLAVSFSGAPQFIVEFSLDVQAVRPLPAYPVPGLMDHF